MRAFTSEELAALNQRIEACEGDVTKKRAILMNYCRREAECKMFLEIPMVDKHCYMQGGGTDGKYLYLCMVDVGLEGGQVCSIVKIDPESGEIVKRGPSIPTDHSNDITYNPKLGQLIVVHNAPSYEHISFVDPETLEEVGTKELSGPIFCMAYNEKRDCYVVGNSGGQDFTFLDADFNFGKRCTAFHTRHTTQGMTCDDDHIYFVQHNNNCIMQYDWEGNFEEYIPLTELYHEPENITFINGKLFIAFNSINHMGWGFRAPFVMTAEFTPFTRAFVSPEEHPALQEKTASFNGDRCLTERYMLRYSDHVGLCREVAVVGPVGEYINMQGGGTDGKYLYYNMVMPGDAGTCVIKVDPHTGEILNKSSDRVVLNHSNDITYNSIGNRLIVVHNAPVHKRLSFVDPDTLMTTGIKDLPFPIFCMAYNAERNAYVVGRSGGQDFSILRSDFSIYRDCLAVHTRYTTQGVTCDRNYIYFVQHRCHCIMKYDWKGNFIEYIPLEDKGGEPENISIIDGKFYVGYNYWCKDEEGKTINRPRFFEVTIVPRDKSPKLTKDMYDDVHKKLERLLRNGSGIENYMNPYSAHSAVCEKRYAVGPFDQFRVLQGGGTDGKYLYLAFVHSEKKVDFASVIVKLVPETGEIVKISKPMELNHTNDITYNSKLGKLVVVHNYPLSDTVSFIDPETLEHEGSRTLDRRIFCLSYNAKRDCYAAGKSNSQDIVIFDGDLNPIADHSALHTTSVTQGMTCDDDYLYYVQFKNNCIMKYDWDGNFIDYIPLGVNQNEPENISFIGDKIYFGFNTIVDKKLDVPEVWEAKILKNEDRY